MQIAQQTIESLTENFALPDILSFDEHSGLTRVQVRIQSAEATIYLHGAHLTHWRPAGQAPAIFLSPNSEFAANKAIRGGIPICFPWFGPRADGQPGPSHGFARISPWELAAAAYLPGSRQGDMMKPDALTLSFVLAPSDQSRALGFDHFRVEYRVTVSETLKLSLTVGNTGSAPLHFEEALHTYFAVSDVRSASIAGLECASYIDKTDSLRVKQTSAGPLVLTAETDSVFFGNTDTTTLHDRESGRTLRNARRDSSTTIVWNPWAEVAAKLADIGSDEWPHFLCVETANTGADAITLGPNETHTLSTEISAA